MGADSPDTWDGSGDDNFDGEGIGMIKPIEPGCLALKAPAKMYSPSRVFRGDLPAHIVTVLEKETPTWMWPCKYCGSASNFWRIDSPLWNIKNHFTCACRLTRIDGHDPDAEITETEKELDKCV